MHYLCCFAPSEVPSVFFSCKSTNTASTRSTFAAIQSFAWIITVQRPVNQSANTHSLSFSLSFSPPTMSGRQSEPVTGTWSLVQVPFTAALCFKLGARQQSNSLLLFHFLPLSQQVVSRTRQCSGDSALRRPMRALITTSTSELQQVPCYLNIYIEMNGHMSIDGWQLAPLDSALSTVLKRSQWALQTLQLDLRSVHSVEDVSPRSH